MATTQEAMSKVNDAIQAINDLYRSSKNPGQQRLLQAARVSLAEAKGAMLKLSASKSSKAKALVASKTSLMPLHNAFGHASDALSEVNSLPKDSDPVVNTALDDAKRSLRAAATNIRFVMNREDEKRSKRANGLKY